MERRLFRLLDRKTVLQAKDAQNLAGYYSSIAGALRGLETSLNNFNLIVQY